MKAGSAYTPLRASTRPTPPNTYTAKPLPWWNRVRLTGTSTRRRTSEQTT